MRILKILLLASGSFALVCLGVTCLQLRKEVRAVSQGIQQASSEIDQTAHLVRTSLADKQNGLAPTLKETHAAVRQTRELIDVALKTSLQERASVAQSSREISSLLAHADAAVVNLNSQVTAVGSSATEALHAIPPTLDQAQLTLASTSRAMDDAAHILSDPSIPDALGAISTMAENGSRMSADAQKKFHLLLFPPKQPWYQRTLHLAETGGRLTFDVLTLTK